MREALTPEQERDFDELRSYIDNEFLTSEGVRHWSHDRLLEALSRLRSDLQQKSNEVQSLELEVERLRGRVALYESALQRAESAEAEVERLAGIVTVERVARQAEVERLQGLYESTLVEAEQAHAEVERLRAAFQLDDEHDCSPAEHPLCFEVERLRKARDEWRAGAMKHKAEVDRLRAWGQQVHDALDGKPLPELPDEAPARIERLRAALEKCEQDWKDMARDVLRKKA